MSLAASVGCTASERLPPARAGSPTGDGPPGGTAMTSVAPLARAGEGHLGALRQLTFGGENAEAYWSFEGYALVYQARPVGAGCDRIYRLGTTAPAGAPQALSSGLGATTCAFFMPGDREIIYSSTHLAGPACPPRPDMSHGYVWAIHPGYDIFRGTADAPATQGSLTRLTATPGYDAEATVCGVDGSIVFTSMRDGDLELYRMDKDGGNVRRLTHDVGYDGGAFFDRDCTRIVWRASRPRPGPERETYQRLLAQGLVRPTRLELWIANADGSDPMQLTYLDAASFAPAFVPGPAASLAETRILFSSNVGDPQGREFDLWAIDGNGANLERITTAPGFDGFPMFSPDGRHLAFSSNRATAPGAHDTNVFVAEWRQATGESPFSRARTPANESGADRIWADARYLAAPEREGRGIGTAGLDAAATYLEARLQRLGLEPAGVRGSYRQPFVVPLHLAAGRETALTLAGRAVAAEDFTPAGFSLPGAVKGRLVLAGYGIEDEAAGLHDYAGLDVRGKIVVVRRFAPPSVPAGEAQRRAGDVRRKAFVAREHGAVALLVVDLPSASPPSPPTAPTAPPPDEAALPTLRPEGYGDAGLPVLFVRRRALASISARLEKRLPVAAALKVVLTSETATAYNIVARVRSTRPEAERLPGVLVLGAHYDHLGYGGVHSLEPTSKLPHLGADDNASGAATLLEAARLLAGHRNELARDVVVAAFSGEEEGVLGSTEFVRVPPAPLEASQVVAMVNLDMVGRLRDNRLTVLGRGSANEWPALLAAACDEAAIDCGGEAGHGFDSDGYGPSDQMPFFAARIPVVHFFTGVHSDYHRPSDSPDKLNVAGAARIALATASLIEHVAGRPERLTLRDAGRAPGGGGDLRTFGASLGTIPDYAGPPGGAPGVLLAGVRPGGGADQGGLRRGDILVKLGKHEIRSVEDLMYALGASHPGESAEAVVKRAGASVSLKVTFQGPPPVPGAAPTPH